MYSYAFRPTKDTCNLCKQELGYSAEENKRHRILCAETNKRFMNSLQKVSDVQCSSCNQCTFVLWPKTQLPVAFFCSSGSSCPINPAGNGSEDSPSPSSITNIGTNCYLCFVCDVFLCSMCMTNRSRSSTNLPANSTFQASSSVRAVFEPSQNESRLNSLTVVVPPESSRRQMR